MLFLISAGFHEAVARCIMKNLSNLALADGMFPYQLVEYFKRYNEIINLQ